MPAPSPIAPRVQRVIRGLAASTTATFVAALFHEAGGGAAPSWGVVAFGLALASLAAIALAGPRTALWRLTAAVAISQLLFHGLFTAAGDASGAAVAADPHAGMAGHGALPLDLPGLGASTGGVGALDAGMLLSHGAALVVTVLALRHGEAALRALVATSSLRVVLALAIPFLRPERRGTALVRAHRAPRPLRDLRARIGRLRHRGPPRATALALAAA
jgi:hypothetical protein